MTRLLAAVVVVAGLLAGGCGGAGGRGTATLWVTRDRGHTVLLQTTVATGQTAMQALSRAAKVETRYGGRYVQAIDGIEGGVATQRDWFYFVNGIEGDRSAVEVRLHAGDVEWWDYRSWRERMRQPVVVGAFPEPFVHGGRPAVVVGSGGAARALARIVRGRVEGTAPADANVLRIVPGRGFAGRVEHGRIVFTLGARDAPRLAADPTLARFRYEGLP